MELKNILSTMSDEQQLKLLATDGMLVKMPILAGLDSHLLGLRKLNGAKNYVD